MVFWRRAFAYFLMFTTLHAFSGALPVSSMQNALSGVIQQKAIKRGFAANDPRYGSTLNLVSSVAGSAAAGAATVALAGLTAPAWITGAIAFGIGAVVSYGVSLAVDGAVKWAFDPDPKSATPITRAANQTPATGLPLVAGQPYWRSTNYPTMLGADYQSLAAARIQWLVANDPRTGFTWELGPCNMQTTVRGVCQVFLVNTKTGSKQYSDAAAADYRTDATNVNSCPGGSYYLDGVGCSALPSQGQPAKTMTAQDAIAELTPEQLAAPVNPQLVASMADKLWRDAAAQPGYTGLPYVANDPITPAEVQTWRDANPQSYPTVKELVSPQAPANSPWSLPQSSTPVSSQDTSLNPSPGTNPAASNPLQNLGPDPGIGAPTLEETPTAARILKPIFDLMPGFKSVDVGGGGGQCPKPEFDALGQHYVVDSHCGLLEQNRALLAAVMAAVWTLASVIVVLRA